LTITSTYWLHLPWRNQNVPYGARERLRKQDGNGPRNSNANALGGETGASASIVTSLDAVVGLARLVDSFVGYPCRFLNLAADLAERPHAPDPAKSNRYDGITYSRRLYKQRNLIERCFNRLKQFRRIAIRYDRNALSYLEIAIVRLWLRFYESTT
jgi:hypothetical protein